MARYRFEMPPGWVGAPARPPHAGTELRPLAHQLPLCQALILVLDALPVDGRLEAQLERVLLSFLNGAHIVRRAEPRPFRSIVYGGLLTAVRLSRPDAGLLPRTETGEEGWIVSLLDAGAERVPVVFMGGERALPLHQGALDTVLSTLHREGQPIDTPFTTWVE